MLANKVLVDRMTKMANDIRSIAPKSDDFLYFSIVFLKSAESALIDDKGNLKKLSSGENAWGFFDENWKWHGNVQPHKNNNSDIFPESELKIATEKWVGMPLCRDHESGSVDGIRGIILDTHYDDKFKQVVGLCALDRINYPDLARKVETGLVRYGSMGTAVEISVCSDCGNRAKTQKEYCQHVTGRAAYGEINVGLKPIEYSLVVQPAEPGAMLLKCIASLKDYRKEFISHGIENVDAMLGALSAQQAEHLEGIMKTACGTDGCSMGERKRIVKSFLKNNGLTKTSELTSDNLIDAERLAKVIETIDKHRGGDVSGLVDNLAAMVSPGMHAEEGDDALFEDDPSLGAESLVSGESTNIPTGDTPYPTVTNSDSGPGLDFTESDTGALPAQALVSEPSVAITASDSNGLKEYVDDISINSIMEDIMNESRLRKRAELRRRVAYHQGGSDGVEPSGTYKDEGSSANNIRNTQDKQMQQTGSMGGTDGTFPGDSQTKEKLSRAAYAGPALRTRFSVKRNRNGSVNRPDSQFQVYSGDNLAITATAGDIFGAELDGNWDWLTSKEYGQEVCKQVRASGLDYVSGLLKQAQDLGAPPPMDAGPPPMDLPPPDLGGDAGLDEGDGEDEAEDLPPGEQIDNRLTEMEGLLDEVRDLVDELEDDRVADVDVNINPGGEAEDAAETLSLAQEVVTQLKTAYHQLDESADEISMVAETYENIGKLSRRQKSDFVKLANSSLKDCDEITGEARALVRVAKTLTSSVKKTANTAVGGDTVDFTEGSDADGGDAGVILDTPFPAALVPETETVTANDDVQDLVRDAMDLRKARRGAILKQAEERLLAERAANRAGLVKGAEFFANDGEDAAADDAVDAADDDLDDKLEELGADLEEAGEDLQDDANDGAVKTASVVKDKLRESFSAKKAEEDREKYRVMLRRAYDVGMEMQRKGLLPTSKAALDRQVDEILAFDGGAFEAFKRSIDNARTVTTVKVATDLGGVNVGVSSDSNSNSGATERLTANALSSMWE